VCYEFLARRKAGTKQREAKQNKTTQRSKIRETQALSGLVFHSQKVLIAKHVIQCHFSQQSPKLFPTIS
jgi:hypothetical protein